MDVDLRKKIAAALADAERAKDLFGLGLGYLSVDRLQKFWNGCCNNPRRMRLLKDQCDKFGVPYTPSQPLLMLAQLGAAQAPIGRQMGRPRGSKKRAATVQKQDHNILRELEKISVSSGRPMQDVVRRAASVGLREGYVREARTAYIRRLLRAYDAIVRERAILHNEEARSRPAPKN